MPTSVSQPAATASRSRGDRQDGEVRGRHEGELRGRLAGAEEVRRVEPEPDVEHLARERRRVLGAQGVHRHEDGAEDDRGLEHPWPDRARDRVEERRDERAGRGNRHASVAEAVRATRQERHRHQDQRLAREDARSDTRREARAGLHGRNGMDSNVPLLSWDRGHGVFFGFWRRKINPGADREAPATPSSARRSAARSAPDAARRRRRRVPRGRRRLAGAAARSSASGASSLASRCV